METGLPANDRNLAWVPLSGGGPHVHARRRVERYSGHSGETGAMKRPQDRLSRPSCPIRSPCMTWKQRNPALAASMKLERLGSMAALLLITLVATFNIMGTVARSVVERRRDIAVLRAMGGSDTLVARIFLWEGVFVGRHRSSHAGRRPWSSGMPHPLFHRACQPAPTSTHSTTTFL
ncbi:MAG: hypothetical protein MZU79_01855 [Anaerotruncus sp.]|nr:hypothetical protein [Anaerotruncus sp.]